MNTRFGKLLYLQVAVGAAAYGAAARHPIVALVAISLVWVGWKLVEGPGGKPFERRWINLAVSIATLWLFFSQLALGGELIDGLGLYILSLQVCKLFERKSNRDWSQLMVLSLMQMVCGAILSNDVIFALLLVVYVGLTIVNVIYYQLKTGRDRVVAARGDVAAHWAGVSTPEQQRGIRRFGFRAGALCVTLAVLVFLMMPRGSGAGVMGRWNEQGGHAQIGYSNDVRLSGGHRLLPNNQPVLNLHVFRDGQNIGAQGRSFLLRGNVLDTYVVRRRGWVRRFNPMIDFRAAVYPQGNLTAPAFDGPVIEQHIAVRGRTQGTLFALYPPVGLAPDPGGMVTFNPHDQVLRAPHLRGRAIEYQVRSAPDDARPLRQAYEQMSRLRTFRWDHYARGPVVDNPDVDALARRIMTDAGYNREKDADTTAADGAIAAAIETHLQSNYRYTLDLPPVPRNQDPIAAFLFTNRAGHCQFFSSAMCALARSLGLRARVVTGFQAVEFNAVGGYYVVRQRNAHAWVEVHTAESGWKVFDPSPPGEIEAIHRARLTWMTGLANFYEHLEFQWISYVITFDQMTQDQITGALRSAWAGVTAAVVEWFGLFGSGPVGVVVGSILLIGALLVLTAPIGRRFRRRRRERALRLDERLDRSERKRLARALGFYARALSLVSRAGFDRPEGMTPRVFARRLAARDASRFGPLVALTDLYYQVRFGGRPLDTDRAEAALTELRRAL